MKDALYKLDYLVMDWILERPGALREMYLTLHSDRGDIKDEEIEWFRKRYITEPAPLYSFIFIARGEFFIHYVSHDPVDNNELIQLHEYGMKNYNAYVDEFYPDNKDAAPSFRLGVLILA